VGFRDSAQKLTRMGMEKIEEDLRHLTLDEELATAERNDCGHSVGRAPSMSHANTTKSEALFQE
jgi:hypothetical protein